MKSLLMCLIMSGFIYPQSDYVTLEQLKWVNRVIITFSNDQKKTESILNKLKESEKEVKDRDIVKSNVR